MVYIVFIYLLATKHVNLSSSTRIEPRPQRNKVQTLTTRPSVNCLVYILNFGGVFFLAMLLDLWNLGFLTRIKPMAPAVEVKSLNARPPGYSLVYILKDHWMWRMNCKEPGVNRQLGKYTVVVR